MVQDVGEQQIVHVAAVAGDIDNFMAVVRQLAYALGVMHVDTPGTGGSVKPRMRSVRRIISYEKFAAISSISAIAFCCAFSCEIFLLRASSSTARAIAFEASSLLNRSWRAGRRGPTAASRWRAKCMRATRASFWAMILSVPCSSAMRRSETDGEKRTKLSRPSRGDGEKFLNAVQHPQRRIDFSFLATRRTAEHDRNRHHLHIEVRMVAVQIEVIVEQLDGLFFWRVISKYARPTVDEYVTRQQGAVDFQRFKRVR